MSRLLVVTRPELAPGFQLAGVEAYGVSEAEAAQELIASWLAGDEVNLIAIDDGLLALMDATFVKRLESAEHIIHLAIPGGRPLGPEATRRYRVAEMIRRAIGLQITFKGEEAQTGEEG